MATSPVSGIRVLGHGVNDSYVVTFADGSKGAAKPWNGVLGSSGLNEVGAWEVAKLGGVAHLVPPVVDREIPFPNRGLSRASVMSWVNGTVADGLTDNERYDGLLDRHRAAVFDYVIKNGDRHEGNWMIRRDGKLQLIDHGIPFFPGMRVMGRTRFITRAVSEAGVNTPISRAITRPWLDNADKIRDKMAAFGIRREEDRGRAG